MKSLQHITLCALATLASLMPIGVQASSTTASSGVELKMAIENGTADTVWLTTGLHAMSAANISVQRSVVVVGADTLCALQCEQNEYHFSIASGHLTLQRLILLGGAVNSFNSATGAYTFFADNAHTGGGIMLSSGSLAAYSCKFVGNRNQRTAGGAIAAMDNVTIMQSTFDGNAADTGAAIYATNLASVRMSGVRVTHNVAQCGGAIAFGGMLGADITVNGSIIESCSANVSGGAIFANGPGYLSLENTTIADCRAAINGGALAAPHHNARTAMRGCTLSRNIALAGDGGALDVAGSLTVSNSTLHNNSAQGNGGAVCAQNMLALNAVSIEHNVSYGNGGGIYMSPTNGGDFFMYGACAINNNKSQAGSGGGLYTTCLVEIGNGSAFNDNEAAGSGGAIYTIAPLSLINVGMSGNRSYENGGAVFCESGNILLDGTTLSANTAGSGAAIYKSGASGSVGIYTSHIVGNVATVDGLGGAVVIPRADSVGIANSTFCSNRGGMGGAVSTGYGAYPVTLSARNTTFCCNRSTSHGGAIYLCGSAESRINIDRCGIDSSCAQGDGAGIYADVGGLMNIRRTTFTADTSAGNGGGLYVSARMKNLLFEKNTVCRSRAAGGGGIFAEASSKAILVQNTFAANVGSGIALAGGSGASEHLLMLNTIATNEPYGIAAAAPTVTNMYGNLLANSDNMLGSASSNSTYNLACSASAIFDHALPADNGGATPTMMIRQGSVAQNGIPSSAAIPVQDVVDEWNALLGGRADIGTDQRDSVRPQGLSLDYGSVERRPTSVPFVKMKTIAVCDAATFDIRELIDSTFNIRDTLYFSDPARADTITGTVCTADMSNPRYYLRFISLDNEVVDRVAEILVVASPQIGIVADFRPHKNICEHGSINLADAILPAEYNAAIDTLYAYRDGLLAQAIAPDEAANICSGGRYYVRIKNRYGCMSPVDSVDIVVDSLPRGTISQRAHQLAVCNNNTAGIMLNTAGVKYAASYTWSEDAAGYMSHSESDTTHFIPAAGDGGRRVAVVLALRGVGACSARYCYDTAHVQVLPLPTSALAEIALQPVAKQEMFFDTTYRVSIKSTGSGALYHLALEAQNPIDQTFKTREPFTDKASVIVSNSAPTGSDHLIWSIDAPRDTLAGGDSITFGFNIYNDSCGFLSGSQLRYTVRAKDLCGGDVASPSVAALPVLVQGVPEMLSSYRLRIATLSDTLNMCGDAAFMRVSLCAVKLDGYALSDSTIEQLSLVLPQGLALVPGSYRPVHNASATTNIHVATRSDGSTEVAFPIRSGIAHGDSSVLTFDVAPSQAMQQAGCGDYAMDLSIFYSYIYTYGAGNADTCQNKVLLSTTSDTVVLSKYDIGISYHPDSVGYEGGWHGVLNIANAGVRPASDIPVRVEIYEDVNVNGALDAGIDTLRAFATTLIGPAMAQTSVRFDSVRVSSGKQLLAVAYNMPSSCQCSEQTLVIPVLQGRSQACRFDTLTYVAPADMRRYTWSIPSGAQLVRGGLSSSSYASLVWTELGRHTLSVECTSDADGNMASTHSSIAVEVLPLPRMALLYDTRHICRGATLDLNSAYPYWGTDTTAVFYTDRGFTPVEGTVVSAAECYYARAYTENGCASTLDSLCIAHDSLPRIRITSPASAQVENCYNRPLMMEAEAAFYSSIAWHSTSAEGTFSNGTQLRTGYLYSGAGIPSDTGQTVSLAVSVNGSEACLDSVASDTLRLLVLPRATTLHIALPVQPAGKQDFCADTVYELLLWVSGGERLSALSVEMRAPAIEQFLVTDDSSRVELPYRSGSWRALANPTLRSGSYAWTLPSDAELSPRDTLRLRTRVSSVKCGANINPGGTELTFGASATAACSAPVSSATVTSQPFRLVDSLDVSAQKVEVALRCSADTLDLCDATTFELTIAVKNNMPKSSPTATIEQLVLYMPRSFSLDGACSYSGPTYNPPVIDNISQLPVGDENRYTFTLGHSIARGDSTVFGICIATQASFCGSAVLRVESTNIYDMYCTDGGAVYPCNVANTIITGNASATLTARRYDLGVRRVYNIDGLPSPSVSAHQRWSGRVVVVNEGITVPAGTDVQLAIYDDINNSSELDSDELSTPLYAEQQLLDAPLASGDSITFQARDVPYKRYHQLLLHASVSSGSSRCICSPSVAPVPIVEGGDVACRAQHARYTTVPGMSGYTWSTSPDGTIIGADTLNEVAVMWRDTGPKRVSVSYIGKLGQRIRSADAAVVAAQHTPLALVSDTLSACAGAEIDLSSAYTGSEQLYFHEGSVGGVAPAGNVARRSGWYYAQTINGSGCWSNYDSVYANIKPYLERPHLNAGALSAMVGDDVVLAVENAPSSANVSYEWAHNGAPYTHSTSPTLTLSDVDTAAAGTYTVAAHDPSGKRYCASAPAEATLRVYHVQATEMVCDASCSYHAQQNEVLHYTIRVRNVGRIGIDTLRVENALPRHTSYVSGGELRNGAVLFKAYNVAPAVVVEFQFSVRTSIDLDPFRDGATIASIARVSVGRAATTTRHVAPACGCSTPIGADNIASTYTGDSTIIAIHRRTVRCSNFMKDDGVNDRFVVENLEQMDVRAELTVLDRHGSTVYASKNYRNDWSVRSRNLAAGVYFYTLVLQDEGGYRETFTGFIHLMK